jgi:hypothetical protein
MDLKQHLVGKSEQSIGLYGADHAPCTILPSLLVRLYKLPRLPLILPRTNINSACLNFLDLFSILKPSRAPLEIHFSIPPSRLYSLYTPYTKCISPGYLSSSLPRPFSRQHQLAASRLERPGAAPPIGPRPRRISMVSATNCRATTALASLTAAAAMVRKVFVSTLPSSTSPAAPDSSACGNASMGLTRRLPIAIKVVERVMTIGNTRWSDTVEAPVHC